MNNIDNTQAFTEGWAIFDCDGSENGQWQLCKVDEDNIFESDILAWAFVRAKAENGSAYHQSALEYLKANNMQEYLLIMKG